MAPKRQYSREDLTAGEKRQRTRVANQAAEEEQNRKLIENMSGEHRSLTEIFTNDRTVEKSRRSRKRRQAEDTDDNADDNDDNAPVATQRQQHTRSSTQDDTPQPNPPVKIGRPSKRWKEPEPVNVPVREDSHSKHKDKGSKEQGMSKKQEKGNGGEAVKYREGLG